MDFTADLEKGVKGLKIGVIRRFYTQDMVADPEMTQGIEDAVTVLERQGAEIHPRSGLAGGARPSRGSSCCPKPMPFTNTAAGAASRLRGADAGARDGWRFSARWITCRPHASAPSWCSSSHAVWTR